MGKPKPHTVATEAMMSTAVEWEIADCGRCAVMDKRSIHPRIAADERGSTLCQRNPSRTAIY